jgi:hypothetical protein
VIKGRTRQIQRFVKAEGRLPQDVFELEGRPRVARMLLLAACDAQQATLARDEVNPRAAQLRLQLPDTPDPRGYRDWSWVAIPLAVPVTVPDRGALHPPALRLAGGRVFADVAFSHAVPKPARTGHTVALGVDWGLNTLLSAGAVRLDAQGRLRTLGAGAQFRAAGVLAKQHRLRRLSEKLHAKADHYERPAASRARLRRAPDEALTARHTALVRELARVGARRSHLNDALAASAARWTVDQAIAAGATVIHAGDLRSMEAKGMGRSLNTRLSQQVRGAITDRIRHLAAEVGIAVVTVPAANTSRHCPRCLLPLRHCAAPDRPTRAGPSGRAGSGPCARTPVAGGRGTATRRRGSASPPAASPTRPRRSPTAPAAPQPAQEKAESLTYRWQGGQYLNDSSWRARTMRIRTFHHSGIRCGPVWRLWETHHKGPYTR